MAGNGRIGGGSCTIEFTVKDNQGNVLSTAKTEDKNAGRPVTVTFRFPDGTSRVEKLKKDEAVDIVW